MSLDSIRIKASRERKIIGMSNFPASLDKPIYVDVHNFIKIINPSFEFLYSISSPLEFRNRLITSSMEFQEAALREPEILTRSEVQNLALMVSNKRSSHLLTYQSRFTSDTLAFTWSLLQAIVNFSALSVLSSGEYIMKISLATFLPSASVNSRSYTAHLKSKQG